MVFKLDVSRLREEKMRFRLDIMVQILIKQGQVEVENGDFIADYSDSLLLHKSVVEDLNGTIRVRPIDILYSFM